MSGPALFEGELLEAESMGDGDVRLLLRVSDADSRHVHVSAEQAQSVLGAIPLGSNVRVRTAYTFSRADPHKAPSSASDMVGEVWGE